MPKIIAALFHLPKDPVNQVIKNIDTYSSKEKSDLLERHKNTFLHVLSAGNSLPTPKRYLSIRNKWLDFLKSGHYITKESSSIFYYSITSQTTVFSGFLCGIALESFQNNQITKHENTIGSRVNLMSTYLETVKIQAEPVMVIHEDNQEILAIEEEIPSNNKASFSFSLNEEEHTLWKLTDKQEQQLVTVSNGIPYFHLADGHHRSACVENLQKRADKKSSLSVYSFLIAKKRILNHSFFWFLKTWPKNLSIQKTINSVKRLQGKKVTSDTKPSEEYPLLICVNHQVYALPKKAISTEIIPDFIKKEFFDNDHKNIGTLSFWPDIDNRSFEDLHHFSSNKLAFNMSPIPLDTLFEWALKNNKLPPKSTYLLPKLLTGLAIASLELND